MPWPNRGKYLDKDTE